MPPAAAVIHCELILYLCLQFLVSVLIFAFCFSLFPDYCVSVIRYPFLFLLRLDGSNRFSGHFQQDCLAPFQRSSGVTSPCAVSNAINLLDASAACKLYCFLFLEFLQIQRRNAVLSLSFGQSDFHSRNEQLMICVAVCSWTRATVHQPCFPSLRN